VSDTIEAQPDRARRQLGQYRLIAELARGGMGVVHLAALCGLQGFRKLVVVKELRPELVCNEAAVAMFMDEARLAARLSHPNIVQTMEVGVDAGKHFIAMEYLDGQPLQKVVRRGVTQTTRVPLRAQIAVVLEVLAALEYAHNLRDFDGTPLGVVHRDVSPHNVFVTYEGHVKLVDFGISKTTTAEAEETRAGVLKGKMRYMAPEQAAGGRVDRRADLFAVGVMLWEAIVGRRAWEGQDDGGVLQSLLLGVVPDIRQARPDVDADLARIVERAMSVDPEARHTSALEMREDLERYVAARRMAVPNARSLGAAVARLFADEREKRSSLIRAQIQGLSPKEPTQRQAPSESRSVPSGEATLSSLARGDASSTPGSSISPRRTPAGSAWSLVWPVVMAVGLGASFALTFLTVNRPGAAATVLGSTSPGAPAVVAVAPALVSRVVVIASPEAARLYIDDAEVPNPYVSERAREATPHRLRAEAPGYEPKTRAVTFAEDISLEVDLVAQAGEGAHPVGAISPRPAARAASAPALPRPYEPETL
jgi:eukaryotic-like serine/threonine-protein kinase